MSWSITAPLNQRARLAVLSFALLMVVVVGLFDFLAGPHFAFTVFYIIPVLVVAWFFDLGPGILLSLLCAAMELMTDMLGLAPGPYPVAAYWDGIDSLAIYLIVTFVVVAFRAVLEREIELARTDPLTGAANSRSFSERAALEIGRAQRNGRPLTVAYVDVDRFKQVNDRFGHSTGDRLLRLIATTIGRDLRGSDMVARLGGDEFAVLLPETNYEAAHLVMSRVHSALDTAMRRDGWPVTFSAGVVTFLKAPENVDSLIHAADKIMYGAKEDGRNTIRHVVAESGALPG